MIDDKDRDELKEIFYSIPKLLEEMTECGTKWNVPLNVMRKKLENLNLKNE